MTAFFDIDTQLDFVYPAGALYTPGAETVIPAVAALNQYASSNGIRLVSTLCSHTEDAAEFKVWPPHCVAGTLGQRKPAATLVPGQIFLEKNELDLFTTPLTESLLADTCVVYGVLTEYCVKLAIMGMLQRGCKVSLVTDAIYHQSESEAARVIAEFRAAGGLCISGAAYR
jgi:nicotinamidase/pyrazinamidase